MTEGRKTTMIWCGAGLIWLVALCTSLASAPNYDGVVTVALVGAAAYFVCANVLRRRTGQLGKAILVLLAVPIAVLTVDNLGRAIHIMGGPLFRVLL
jgi:hypothetical protein